ncbi:MAG: hypothetical protein WAP35_06790 [Solirubrobacterales bacterium]
MSVSLNALSLAIISRRLGEFDLGLYSLERRSMALLQPLALMGLSVATPRYVALALAGKSGRQAEYAIAGVAITASIGISITILILLFPHLVALVVFGDAKAIALAQALAGFTLAMTMFQIVYSVFRGRLAMTRANLLELSVIGVVPVTVAALGSTDLVRFMWTLNTGIAVIILITLLVHLPALPLRTWPSPRVVLARGCELLKFGLVRTPGDLSVVALFSLAPIAVVHWAGAVDAGYTAVVQSSVNLVSVFAVPLGVVLLPHVATEAASARGVEERRYRLLSHAAIDMSIGVAAVFFVASPLIVGFWLPSAPASAVHATEVAAFAIPGYVFYLIFRSYLDAIDTRPLSSIAVTGALLLLIVLLPVTLVTLPIAAPVAASVSVAAALTFAGTITFWFTRHHVSGMIDRQHAVFGVVALGTAVPLGVFSASRGPLVVGLSVLAVAMILTGMLVALRRQWLVELRSRLFGRARSASMSNTSK